MRIKEQREALDQLAARVEKLEKEVAALKTERPATVTLESEPIGKAPVKKTAAKTAKAKTAK